MLETRLRSTGASGGGGLTVSGTVITGGTNTRVLFDDNGVVGESARFVFNKTTGSVTIKSPSDSQLLLDADSGGQYTGLYWNNNGIQKAYAYWDNTGLQFIIGTSTGNATVQLQTSGATRVSLDVAGAFTSTTGTRTAGVVSYFKINTPADTTLTASTESIGIRFGGDATAVTVTRQWATGALTTQRENVFIAPTYGFVGATTLTDAATVAISAAPIAGTNATITNAYALWVQTGNTLLNGTLTTTNNITVTSGGLVVSSDVRCGAVNAFLWTGRSQIFSAGDGQIQITNNAATDFTILQFGQRTSSFPGLKRSSATLQVRLADDSDFADFSVRQLFPNNQIVFQGASVSAWNITASNSNSQITLGALDNSFARISAYGGSNTLAANAGGVVINASLNTTSGVGGYVKAFGGDGSGSNIAGGPVTIGPGKSTGSATPAIITLQGTIALASGSTSQTLSDVLIVRNATSLEIVPTITKYNGVSTAGWGVPAVYGSGRSTAQIAAVASVATYTVGAADGSFLITSNVNVTTSTAHSFTVTCAYTDETNTSRTLTLSFIQIGGGTPIATITNITGAGPYEGVPNHIRCKASTSITIATTGTFTTVTYNVEAAVIQIA